MKKSTLLTMASVGAVALTTGSNFSSLPLKSAASIPVILNVTSPLELGT